MAKRDKSFFITLLLGMAVPWVGVRVILEVLYKDLSKVGRCIFIVVILVTTVTVIVKVPEVIYGLAGWMILGLIVGLIHDIYINSSGQYRPEQSYIKHEKGRKSLKLPPSKPSLTASGTRKNPTPKSASFTSSI